jgi:ribosomal protein S18 acetylase RimI-like enzyme
MICRTIEPPDRIDKPPMQIRPYRADEGMLIKRVRLRALAEAPYAFGVGSYEEEAAYPDSYWHQLAAQVGGEDPKWQGRCVSFVVLDGEEACGAVTCYLCPRVSGRAYVTAAWIEPRYRGQGLGRQLVEAAMEWATAHGADHVRLWVDDTNPDAAEFYQALGFVATGESQPVSEGAVERQSGFERRVKSEE